MAVSTLPSERSTRTKFDRLERRSYASLFAAVLLVIAAAHMAQEWLSYQEAWIHPELIGASDHVWAQPDAENWIARLAKSAEINDTNRVRPLSKLVEVVDAMSRPYITRLLVPHPGLAPSTVATLVLPTSLMFVSFRGLGLGSVPSAALLMVFASSTGFLSTIAAYDRPAKKLSLIFFALAFYFAQRYARRGGRGAFAGLIFSLLCAFFSDEEDLGFFFVFGVVFFPWLLWRAPNWKRAVFLGLPLVFVVVAEWGLRALYAAAGTLQGFSPFGEQTKFQLLAQLATLDFYRVGLKGLANGMLSTLGIRAHAAPIEAIALGVLGVGSAVVVWRLVRQPTGRVVGYQLAAAGLALGAAGVYVTLLDLYPSDGFGTNGRGYMGEFTYYYHSSLAPLVVVWLAFAWLGILRLSGDPRVRRAIVGVGVALCATAFAANVALFHDVNRLMQIIHTYPYPSGQLYQVLLAQLPEIKRAQPRQAIPIVWPPDAQDLSQEFDSSLVAVFGPQADWSNNGFYLTMRHFQQSPMIDRSNLQRMLHMYFPYNTFQLRTSEGSSAARDDQPG